MRSISKFAWKNFKLLIENFVSLFLYELWTASKTCKAASFKPSLLLFFKNVLINVKFVISKKFLSWVKRKSKKNYLKASMVMLYVCSNSLSFFKDNLKSFGNWDFVSELNKFNALHNASVLPLSKFKNAKLNNLFYLIF